MCSQAVRIPCSVTGTVAVIVATLLSLPGTVLCIDRDHTAIEAAHAGKCVLGLGKSSDNAPLTVGSKTGTGTCASCFDIALNGGAPLTSTPSTSKDPSPNHVPFLPFATQTLALPVSVPAVSAQSKCRDARPILLSTTILRI